jgi:hypothetical protein
MECDWINTLINVSEEYTGGDDVTHLKALRCTWVALDKIISKTRVMEEDQKIALFDAGISVISQLKSVDGSIASITLLHVSCTFKNIHVTKKCFQDKDILSKCLEVFKKDDGTWTSRSEIVMARAIGFFYKC